MFKRVLLVLLLSGAACTWAQGTAAIQGHSYLGGTRAQVSGLTSSNYLNGIIPHATITVYLTGTQTLATIYADANSTPLSNPFTSNDAGSLNPGGWLFFSAINQGYDVCMSGGVAPNTYSQPVCLTDVFPGNFFTPPLALQTNGTSNASQNLLNFLDSATVSWMNPSGGIEQANVLVSGGFQNYVPDPLGTQSVLVTATSFTIFNDGDPINCPVSGSNTSGVVQAIGPQGNLGCLALPGPSITWTGFTLPSYVLPANVTAVYPVSKNGFSGGALNAVVKCSVAGNSVNVSPNAGVQTYWPIQSLSGLLTGATGSNIASVSCVAGFSNNGLAAGQIDAMNIPYIALRVYYTGTAPPASDLIYLGGGLYYNPATNTMSVAAVDLAAGAVDGGVIGLLPQSNLAPPTQTTLTGTTAGTAVWSQPQQFSTWKVAVVYLNGYENTTATAQTITLPAGFGTVSAVLTDSGTCTGVTVSGATVTLPASMGAPQTGLCEIRGY